MYRCWLLRLLLFTSLSMLLGCGTVRNFEKDVPLPGHKEDPEGPGSRQIYGGVLFDLQVGPECLLDPSDILPFWHLAGAYLVIVDLPLSFVADTLSLPWTISTTMNRVKDKQDTEPGQTGPAPSKPDPAKTP